MLLFIMAFFGIFSKKTEHNTSIESFNKHLAEINNRLAEHSERLHRIDIKQKETSIQLEEIDALLQNDNEENSLIDALIGLIGIIGDFYYFAAADTNSSLFEQAQMMWNTAIKAAQEAGLQIIDAGNEPFDFNFHSAESTEQNHSLPNGYVIKTLKCGYIYKGIVLQRASVVINKTNTFINDYSIYEEGTQ